LALMGEQFAHGLRAFADNQRLGWCLAFVLAATSGGALLLSLLVLLRRTALKATIWTGATAASSLVLAGIRIASSRSELVDLLLDRHSELDPSQRARLVSQALDRVFITVHVVSPIFAFAMLALLLAAARSRSRTMERRLAVLATSLALLCAVLLYGANGNARQWPCPDSEDWLHCGFQRASENLQTFRLGAWGLLAAGSLAWLYLARAGLRDAQRGVTIGFRTRLICSVLLVVGVGAFGLTRAQASDAAHLVPADPANVHECLLMTGLQAQLPQVGAACLSFEAPLVQLQAERVFIDGTAMSGPEEAGQVLSEKRKLWQLLSPARSFHGVVTLAAPQDAKTEQLLPLLQAFQGAGFDKLAALQKVRPVVVQTRTVGRLEKARCCSALWSIDAGTKAAFTRFETWGELLAKGGASLTPAVLETNRVE
jgi:hypothetical protein